MTRMDRLVLITVILQYSVLNAETRIAKPVDPEVYMNTSEIISYHGYPSEEHDVTTSDGYILSVQRIPGPKQSAISGANLGLHYVNCPKVPFRVTLANYVFDHVPVGDRPVVLLWHGLLSCSACWVENLVDESLGFILADAGYDVWLGNSRGNTYGRRHKTLTPDQDEFWAFSFDDMAKYDLPATIDYILSVTGQSSLAYVGHSQGTMIMFAAQAEHHVPVDKVKLFVALGPAAYLNHLKSPIGLLAGLPDKTLTTIFGWKDFLPQSDILTWLGSETLTTIFGKKDFLPHSDILTWLGSEVCSRTLPGLICENVLFLLGGYDFKNMNESRIPVYIGQHPAGTSVQNMIHYAQAVRSGSFQMFDFGPDENMKKYNSTTPPQFKTDEITVPVALFSGPNDWLTVLEDIERLEKELPTVAYSKVVPDWEHLDFIWAVNAPQACYADILRLLATY